MARNTRWTIFSYGLRSGAFANLSRALADGLVAHGVEVHIVYLVRSGDVDEALGPGVTAVPIPGRARWSFWPLAGYLRQARPDVFVSLGSMLNGPSVVGRSIARVPSLLLLSEHSAMSHEVRIEHAGHRLLTRAPMIARALYGRADGVVAVSKAVLDDLVDQVGIDPRGVGLVSIPNPVHIDRVRDLARRQLPDWFDHRPDEPLFVSMGRLADIKNQSLLIESFGQYFRRNSGGHLVIMGEGPLRDKLEKQVDDLALNGRVSLPGYTTNPFGVLARADALVLSSEEEGFGLVLVEAMALGVPIVATDSPGGVREVLRDGAAGLLVPNGDAVALADGMEAVTSDQSLADRLRTGSIETIRDYDPVKIARRWIDFAASVSRVG